MEDLIVNKEKRIRELTLTNAQDVDFLSIGGLNSKQKIRLLQKVSSAVAQDISFAQVELAQIKEKAGLYLKDIQKAAGIIHQK